MEVVAVKVAWTTFWRGIARFGFGAAAWLEQGHVIWTFSRHFCKVVGTHYRTFEKHRCERLIRDHLVT